VCFCNFCRGNAFKGFCALCLLSVCWLLIIICCQEILGFMEILFTNVCCYNRCHSNAVMGFWALCLLSKCWLLMILCCYQIFGFVRWYLWWVCSYNFCHDNSVKGFDPSWQYLWLYVFIALYFPVILDGKCISFYMDMMLLLSMQTGTILHNGSAN
jgi:hypothetical protein